MRFAAAFLAVTLVVQPCLAQPLSPGHPAGVRQARMSSSHEAWMITTGALVMIGVGILASGGAGSDALGTQDIPSNAVPVAPIVTSGTSG
jgi:hypothetical protein